jgi:hypothetical protein
MKPDASLTWRRPSANVVSTFSFVIGTFDLASTSSKVSGESAHRKQGNAIHIRVFICGLVGKSHKKHIIYNS